MAAVRDHDDTSSEESITSEYRRRYVCSHCNREFDCGHAFGGHHNAHRTERKKRYLPRSLEMVLGLSNPVSTGVQPPATLRTGAFGIPPVAPTLGVQFGFNGSGEGSSSLRPLVGLRVNNGYHRFHPYQRQLNVGASHVGRFLNVMAPFRGPWNINNGGVGSSLDRTIADPVGGLPRKENDGEDQLDLELRLGFRPV